MPAADHLGRQFRKRRHIVPGSITTVWPMYGEYMNDGRYDDEGDDEGEEEGEDGGSE